MQFLKFLNAFVVGICAVLVQVSAGDVCALMTCPNGGTCEVDDDGDPICHCPYPYAGIDCVLENPPCCVEDSDIKWVEGTNPPRNTVVSECSSERIYSNGTCLYVGRTKANDEGNYIPGKIVEGVCYVASGGRVYNSTTYQVLTNITTAVSWVRADVAGAHPPACAVLGDTSVENVYIGRRIPKDIVYGVGQVSNNILTTTNNEVLNNITAADGFEYLVCIAPEPESEPDS